MGHDFGAEKKKKKKKKKTDCEPKQSHRQFNNQAPPREARSRAERHSDAEAADTKRIDVSPLYRASSE